MTYSRAISCRMISTRSSLAAASPARAFVPFGHSSVRKATTFCSLARASRTARINATLRAIRRGFPSDIAKISAATISAADSSEMFRSGLCLGNDNRALLRPDAITHGHAFPRKGKSRSTLFVNHFPHNGRNRPLSGAALCCLTVSGRAPFKGAGNLWRLPEGFGAATPCRFLKPVGSPVNHLTRPKVHGDDLGHVCLSYPSGKPVRPRLVSL